MRPPIRLRGRPPSRADARMHIDTYFGFFATAVLTALGTGIGAQVGQAVNLAGLRLSTTNTLKLRWSAVDTVLLPRMVERTDVPFVFALAEPDRRALERLAGDRVPLQKLMEEAVSSAVEPFNFVNKRRNRLTGLQFSRNVTGFTAHHLHGEVSYTMATGSFATPRGQSFALRLLVTPGGRDLIEERATQKSTQRALFSINEGAYLCRPQWEPPPPPPGLERGTALSETMLNGWLQTFFGLNDGTMPNRLFQRPVGLLSQTSNTEALGVLADTAGPPTVARLQLNGQRALEVFAVFSAPVAQSLLRLSRSGQERFLGDMLRALYGDAARLWEAFTETPVRWRLLACKPIKPETMDAVTRRVADGGLVVRQVAHLDEGFLEWYLAVPPHTWQWLVRLTARGMSLAVSGAPHRQAVFRATGWGTGSVPWRRLMGFLTDRELQGLVRVLQQARVGEGALAAVAADVEGALRERWLDAMPVMLRERTERYELAEGEAPRRLAALTRTLVGLQRARKLPEGRLSRWTALYIEYLWSFRQHAIERLLPLRHLVYGMDRGSLSRLLFDVRSAVLVDALTWAEFPVVDQVRRAISPGFAVRLLEDVAVQRPRLSAFGAQEAQLALYRQCLHGVTDGRYLLRATPADRLHQLFRLLEGDEG